jgi:hypothetical protein
VHGNSNIVLLDGLTAATAAAAAEAARSVFCCWKLPKTQLTVGLTSMVVQLKNAKAVL